MVWWRTSSHSLYPGRVDGQFPGAREFPTGTRTAVDAAAAIGCSVTQIVKSLVFRAHENGSIVLVLCAGGNTVDSQRLGLEKADADLVREVTGYPIGGVPPWGWATAPALALIDRDLFDYEEVWAAAGTANSVFPLSPNELLERTAAEIADVAPQ
jgi:prolyl-tRNA editing enzyme YbaK/EbsC (Cys-tRNA(Pro) deacylase)